MAAEYPSGVYSPRTKENKSGVVYAADKKTVTFAEDITKLDDEVVAIETELGANPRGDQATVKARLDYLDFFKTTFMRICSLLFYEMLSAIEEDGGTINAGVGQLSMYTGAVADSSCRCEALPRLLDYSKVIRWSIDVYKINISANGQLLFQCDMDEWDLTGSHIGFKVIGSTVYATNGNNYDAETATDITAQVSIGTGLHKWGFVFTPGVNIKFYFDGVLVATHTTNLPTSGSEVSDNLFSARVWNDTDEINNSIEFVDIAAEIDY